MGAHITPLPMAASFVITEPTRTRKLLLNRREIDRLTGAVERKGYTVVPLSMYWKDGRAKIEIGVAKGTADHDKRATEKDRDWARDKSRTLRDAARR